MSKKEGNDRSLVWKARDLAVMCILEKNGGEAFYGTLKKDLVKPTKKRKETQTKTNRFITFEKDMGQEEPKREPLSKLQEDFISERDKYPINKILNFVIDGFESLSMSEPTLSAVLDHLEERHWIKSKKTEFRKCYQITPKYVIKYRLWHDDEKMRRSDYWRLMLWNLVFR